MANSNLMNVMQQVVDYQEEQDIEREEEEQAIQQEIEEQKYEDGYQQQDYQYDDNNYWEVKERNYRKTIILILYNNICELVDLDIDAVAKQIVRDEIEASQSLVY